MMVVVINLNHTCCSCHIIIVTIIITAIIFIIITNIITIITIISIFTDDIKIIMSYCLYNLKSYCKISSFQPHFFLYNSIFLDVMLPFL